MRHAAIINQEFRTCCEIPFKGTLLKGLEFKRRTPDAMQTVDCLPCREKVMKLLKKVSSFGYRGGRCVFIDLEEEPVWK